LPIDTTTLQAHEISQMLENMYFEWLKDEPSKLVGTILIGNIPLPVVEDGGFMYPSIYPYVDFEHQQFIYNTNKKFFVYNDNPNGQAEIRHGMIKFDTSESYNQFFTKVRSYYNNPTDFVDKTIRYDDFIGLKKYFIPENTKYYVNSMIFWEDIGYHRFTSLLLDTLTSEHNSDTLDIGDDLASNLENIEDQDLKDYGEMISTRNEEAKDLIESNTANLPTLTLMKSTQEMLKTYDGMMSTMFQSKIKENIAGAARRYKNTEGESFTDINGTTDKINQQDNRIVGDLENNVQGLLIQINEYMEKGLNDKIEQEKYYLTVPVPVEYLKVQGQEKKGKCIWPTYDYFHTYYFWKDVNFLKSAEDTSIYKWTYQNLNTLSGQSVNAPLQSIGWSFKVFSTQIEANRGYNIGNAEDELERYNANKTNKQELRGLNCTKYLFNRESLNICIKKRVRKPDDSATEDKCNRADTDQQGGCETPIEFANRNRWGASPLNLNTNMNVSYDYKAARLPIYDIAGSKKITTAQPEANTSSWVQKYAALIQNKLGAGDLQYSNNLSYLIKYPQLQGSDLLFTNQYPYGNLKNPTRGTNPPKTYEQTDFFTIYNSTTSRTISTNKAVLYNRTNATDDEDCNVQGDIYTYQTLDSRIKNISPTWDQISDTVVFKFKTGSDIYQFYTDSKQAIQQTSNDIVEKTTEFAGTTWVIGNLTKIRDMINSGNDGIQTIVNYNILWLGGLNSTQITNKASERNTIRLDQSEILEISGSLKEIRDGLNDLLDYINTVSVANVQYLMENIIQFEKYKNQNVEIRDTRKTELTNEINTINTNIAILKAKFLQAQNIYNSIVHIQDKIPLIIAKKTTIAALNLWNGCDSSHYLAICNVLDNIIYVGNLGIVDDTNDFIDKIESYQTKETNQRWGFITIEPFIEINSGFLANEISGEINQVKTTMNIFDLSTDTEKTEVKKGMNLTTTDRPIDNIRNITFKGIGWDDVRLNYPNLYEVEVYKKSAGKLVLKTPEEIKTAIKKYLTDKAVEHNTLLEVQKNKKNSYYASLSAQFNFLGQLDVLANPNTHNYNLLPTDFFVNKLIAYLNDLQQEYGSTYIYGKNIPASDDEKLDMVANFLYQQNMARPEKLETDTVVGNINESKASFDINYRISNAVKTYLQENNNQGSFITPTYNAKGYEVGFINSDGKDYVSAKSVPSFIQQIQNIQAEQAEIGGEKQTTNAFIQDPTQKNDLQQDIDSCEGVDTDGTSLLFDFKTFTRPRSKAMKCRGQKIFEKPFDIQISFKQSLGQVVMGPFTELQNTIENFWSERKKYGDQRNTPDNEELIATATGTVKEKLQGYNTNALVDIEKTIVSVDSTGTNTITISATKDIGTIKIRIAGVGDNCFWITKNTTTLSNDICENPARDSFNAYNEPTVFKLDMKKPKAGSTAVKVEICLPTVQDDCIMKSQVINILPGPVETITMTAPDIVMEGSEIPIIVTAQDAYGNKIGQTVESYMINVLSGNGKITDGSASNNTIEFNNFSKAGFIYQALTGLTANKSIGITITPKDTGEALLAIQPTAERMIQKNIIVAKGIVTVNQNTTRLYKTTTDKENEVTTGGKIIFTLPKDEAQIQYKDENDIPQIVEENIPKISIRVEDPNGHTLDTIAKITTTKGLLMIGNIEENSITKGNTNLMQTTFSKANDFLIEDGRVDISLYPTFKAGDDTLTIQIPGLDPINIPITVYAGEAKKVILTLEKTKLDLTTNTSSKGMIQIVDSRNNKVNRPTLVKLGTIGAAQTNTNEFTYSWGEYTYTLTTKQPGGEGYVFAYIKDRQLSDQFPWYERFIIQESILPKEKLNVMYLNLFWTDWGNQRWYFSENEKTVNKITEQSNKLLATTTQLVDPNKIKQIEYIISQNGQIRSINETPVPLTIENKQLMIRIPNVSDINLGASDTFTIQSIEDTWSISESEKDENTIIYIPEETDSIITSNEATRTKIRINDVDIIDIDKGIIDSSITIETDGENIEDMSTYTMKLNGKKIATLLIWKQDIITINNVDINDPILYGKTNAFSEGSTNNQGIGIYLQSSAFTKKGYASIEDSADALLGIGFTSEFKNVTNFANGKIVGEATIPYGSNFLINFWDPLLERTENNPEIPDTDFDASIGQTIYTDPTKTILKVLPIDFNNDNLKDLLVVYTDGTVKLLKNYGGKESYRNLQELMIIAEPIKDIRIGDLDGNKYDDILIITTNKKWLAYLNDEGIFAVDGKNICLNISQETDSKNPSPEDFSNINQLFIEDMDQDGILDIVTNDEYNNATIFYGGETNDGPNYLSTTTGTCDADWYERQKDNYTVVKRFWMRVNSNRRIQDNSLIHRKGADIPKEGVEEEVGEEDIDTSSYTKDDVMDQVKNFTQNLGNYIATWAEQLEYIQNPLTTSPAYEIADPEEIYYLPINGRNWAVSVYKQYQDMNGWILQDGDSVAVQTTFIAMKNTKLTYIDLLKWPREIVKNEEKKITSLVFTQGNTWNIDIDWNAPDGYQFTMDNIVLNSWQKLSFSYTVTYQQKEVTKIDIDDIVFSDEDKEKDQYPEIIITSTDACQKGRRLLFNEKTGKKRSYEEFFDDIQAEIDEYYSGAQNTQTETINDFTETLGNVDGLESLSTIPGMSESLESRNNTNMLTPKELLTGLFSRAASQGWGINVNMNFIDAATSKVAKKIDENLDGLCQGFSLGEGGCQGVPVPFNQAFLAPGEYHIFGCVPKLPNPLYVPFKLLNQTLGKGLPIIAFPTSAPVPIRPPTPVGAWGILQGSTSQFRLYIAPTLTLGLGIAMCFWPYAVGVQIPKPFGDLWGNCIVFALPPITTCPEDSGDPEYYGPKTETQKSDFGNAAKQGICTTPPKISNTIVFDEETSKNKIINTPSAPFEIVAAQAQDNTPYYWAAIIQGNFWGLVEMDYDPITVTSTAWDTDTYEGGYELKKWEEINLKILGAKSKGLVQCVVQDRFTRQIQYIQNNLTKMTIQLDLPDITTVFEGFDKIGNLKATYKEINNEDSQAGYTQVSDANAIDFKPNQSWGTVERTKYLSKQQINNINEKYGSNPFEAIQQIFQEVPLVNIDSQDINIKIPALTSDDIKNYQSYLTLWIEKNAQVLEDRWELMSAITATCSTSELKENIKNVNQIKKQIKELEYMKIAGKISEEQKKQLEEIQQTYKQVEMCIWFNGQLWSFLSFQENTAELIQSVKANINTLEQYKEFPTQLYERTHITDRYLTELSAVLSEFVGTTNYRLNTNANRFSSYVDALVTMVWAIKTWQAIIDFSVNRSEKCSKCSNDNYGSFSCSLSFLCPKLPIFPIPAFKIPNIYMDMSHIELGMNIVLPKVNFVPTKIPLPQLPNLPEPPSVEVNWDILYSLDINFFVGLSMPTIPVIPEPPTLPEPPSFIPSVNIDLPVLPPAPKIPKIMPEINGVLKVADFVGKIFCIVKWGIGLVGEKWVKGKVEQITQRTRNVPIFDTFDLTTKFKDPPLQWFDYKLDAYFTLKFNFDGVYDVFNNIANASNNIVSKGIEAPTQKAIENITNTVNNNRVTDTGFEFIEGLDQDINLNGYNTIEESGMVDYRTVQKELKQGLISFQNSTLTDKAMNNRVKAILATVENTSTITPASQQIQEVENAAQGIIQKQIQKNKERQKEVENYDDFIEKLKDADVVLVDDDTISAKLTTPLLTIDTHTKNILQSQEDPTKTYLNLNKKMVEGYLYAINTDGPEKLNMTQSTYNKSKKYLETTKKGIDTALLAYEDTPLLAQWTCTDCENDNEGQNNYASDISAYVQGIFVESTITTGEQEVVNTVISTQQIDDIQQNYTTDVDINNDDNADIIMYNANSIFIKYAKQEDEYLSAWGNGLTRSPSNKFYSYANEHPWNQYITSLDQLRENSDEYGYTDIEDISIKIVQKNKEVKWFKTNGQTFDTLQFSWKNSKELGESIDGYIIKMTDKIDDKDTPISFWDFFRKKPKYIVVLPKGTEYTKGLITIDGDTIKKPINLELGDSILAVEYYDPTQNNITVTLKDMERKRLYTNIAALTITQEDLTANQRESFILYKKTSPWSNQTVAGVQNLWDLTAPVGDVVLWRNMTNEAISTGNMHEWYINTNYTLKSIWNDNVIVFKMIVKKDWLVIIEKENNTQTGTIDVGWLFFTGTNQQTFEFIAIDQNNNVAKEIVTLSIKIPDIQVIDIKKSGEETADVIAKISNDMDEGMVIFQRLRNNMRKNIEWSNQNNYGGFDLSPKQTIITWGIFTIGNDVGLFDNQGNEIAKLDPDTGEITINSGYENKIQIHLSLTTHIPVIELKDTINNITLFQIVLPVESITDTQIYQNQLQYEQIVLEWDNFGIFNGGYCIKNIKNDCITYTNKGWSIYIPGIYASSLRGTYKFDTENKKTTFTIKEQSGNDIASFTLKIKATE